MINDDDCTVMGFGDRWTPEELTVIGSNDRFDANVAEALALRELMRRFVVPSESTLHIVVDNTTLRSAIDKGVSRSGGVSAIVDELRHELAGVAIKTSYVSTRLNPADEPSRMRLIDVAKLRAA